MTVGDLIDGLINSATSVPNWFADGWQKLSKGELLELTIPQGAFTLLCIYVASMMLASWSHRFSHLEGGAALAEVETTLNKRRAI